VGTYLADMLCEAVPRARRPNTHRPKHSVTSGEFQSWFTGYGTRTPIPRAQLRSRTGNLGVGAGAQVKGVFECERGGEAVVSPGPDSQSLGWDSPRVVVA
jgi:hypothetical protein